VHCHDDEKLDHITPVLDNLHWLPVTARIQFRIALLTFKTFATQQPSYISDLLQPHCSVSIVTIALYAPQLDRNMKQTDRQTDRQWHVIQLNCFSELIVVEKLLG